MAKKPLVTANQVTLSRLLLLPIGAALLYGNKTALWVALVFMTIVGCTDFVDGWLARKYGSTELGRLMDPIADKVFVMVAFMPLIDLKWLVPWQVGLFLMREYVITGLRSAYERRHISPRTTLLAKIKAWAQMAGCGFLFFLQMLPERTMLIVLIIGTLLPLAFAVVRYAVQRYFWWGTFIFAGWVGVLLPPMWLSGRVATTDFLMLTVIGITWLSGWGYVAPSLPMILQRRFDLSDWVRILGGIVGPVLLILAFSRPELPHWGDHAGDGHGAGGGRFGQPAVCSQCAVFGAGLGPAGFWGGAAGWAFALASAGNWCMAALCCVRCGHYRYCGRVLSRTNLLHD
jgi:CDP-diacylglycerol--glycerol-3-phosphate 3-phosphatidyltransferase